MNPLLLLLLLGGGLAVCAAGFCCERAVSSVFARRSPLSVTPKLDQRGLDGSAGRAASRVRRGRPLDAIIHVRR